MKIKTIPTVLFILLSTIHFYALAWKIESSESQFLKSIEPSREVFVELNKFFNNSNSKVVNDYISEFVAKSHQLTLNKLGEFNHYVQSKAPCSSKTQIEFKDKFTSHSIGKNFEKNLISVEFTDCLGRVNIHKAFEQIMSEDFQLRNISELKEMKVNKSTNYVCQKTYAFGVGKSDFCFTFKIFADETSYVIHSFNEMSHPLAQAPVYFRESLTVLKLNKETGLVYLYVYGLGRGPNLPFHGIVTKVIRTNQIQLSEALKESLQ